MKRDIAKGAVEVVDIVKQAVEGLIDKGDVAGGVSLVKVYSLL